MENHSLCPCCKKYYRNFQEDLGICPVCGWEEDYVQEDEPDYVGGANILSLNQSRALWQQTGTCTGGGIPLQRFYAGLPLFDESGKVILERPQDSEPAAGKDKI